MSKWEITQSYFTPRGELSFEICQGPNIWFTDAAHLDAWVDEAEITAWIKRDSRGAVSTLDDYDCFLTREDYQQRVQLFYGDYKLFSFNLQQLKHIFGVFKTQNCNQQTFELTQMVAENDEAIIPVNYDQSDYKEDVIAFVMSAAIDGNLSIILQHDLDFVHLDAAANLMENLEISSQIWSTAVAEVYIRARMKNSFKELKQMCCVPGVVKSSVIKQAIKNVVAYMESQIDDFVCKYGYKLDTMNSNVKPSQDALSCWIDYGLSHVELSAANSPKIIFTSKMSKSALIRCLQSYDCDDTRGVDKLGIARAVVILVSMINDEKVKLSQDVIDVWRMIWKLFKHSIESWVFSKSLMLICYHLSIQTGDYDDWKQGWIHLLANQDDVWGWHYYVRDVCITDMMHANFTNTDGKNDCIVKGIRRFFYILGEQEHWLLAGGLRFIPQVIDWLDCLHRDSCQSVFQELSYNVNKASNILGQFHIVLTIYQYYAFKTLSPIESGLQQMFNRYLTV